MDGVGVLDNPTLVTAVGRNHPVSARFIHLPPRLVKKKGVQKNFYEFMVIYIGGYIILSLT